MTTIAAQTHQNQKLSSFKKARFLAKAIIETMRHKYIMHRMYHAPRADAAN